MSDETCTWKNDDCWSESVWESDCGHAWRFDEGGPKENRMNFCPFCGKELMEMRMPNPMEEGCDDAPR